MKFLKRIVVVTLCLTMIPSVAFANECTFYDVLPKLASNYLQSIKCSYKIDQEPPDDVLRILLEYSSDTLPEDVSRSDCMSVHITPCAIFSPDGVQRYWKVSLVAENYKGKKKVSNYNKRIKRIAKKYIGDSDYDTAKNLYEYVKSVCRYPDANEDVTPVIANVKEHIFVCAEYSLFYRDLLQAAGIPCITVDGFSARGAAHSWNLMKIDDRWCYSDVTWDDYDGTNDYFCISEEQLLKDHVIAPLMLPIVENIKKS